MKSFLKNNYIIIIKIILVIYSLFSLKYLFRLKNIEAEFFTNVTFIFIVAGLSLLINYGINTLKKGIDKGILIITSVLGLYFAFVLLLGTYYDGVAIIDEYAYKTKYEDFTLSHLRQALFYIPSVWFICFSLMLIVFIKLPEVISPVLKKDINFPEKYNSLWKIWLFIFICWIPYFILLYPGYIFADGNYQIKQVVNGSFNTSHPLLTTLSHYWTYFIYKTTGNGRLSLATYNILFQIIPFSFAFAYMLHRAYNLFKINNLVFILLVLYCALYPANPLWAILISKDTVFFLLFVLFFTESVLLIYKPELLKNKLVVIRYIILAVIVMLVRHNMAYGLFIALPFFLIIAKNYRKEVIFIFITIFISYNLSNAFLMNVTNAKKGNFRESLSLPMQQLARVYNFKQDNLSKEHKKYIESVIKKDNITDYATHISDPIKKHFKTDVFLNKESILKYIDIGLTYPTTYLNSILLMTIKLWYPFEDITWRDYVFLRYLSTKPLDLTKKEKNKYQNKKVDEYFKWVVRESKKTSFFYFYLFNQTVFFYILLFSFIYFVYKKEYRAILCLLIPLGYLATILLAPVVYPRYTYYIMCIFPIIIMLLVKEDRSANKLE